MGQDAPPIVAARREWETDPHNPFGIEGEDADPYHQRVFGAARAGREAARAPGCPTTPGRSGSRCSPAARGSARCRAPP